MIKRNRRKVWLQVGLALLLAGLLVQGGWAGNFHFNSLTFGLGSFVAQGSLAGLGNEAAEVTLTAYGSVTALCQNKGGQQAPGRNPVAVSTRQTEVFVTGSNGLALVRVSVQDPTASGFEPSPTPKEAGCPNGNWTVAEIVDGSTDWTAATVVVKDGLGQVQLELSFTCTTYFVNGVSVALECVES